MKSTEFSQEYNPVFSQKKVKQLISLTAREYNSKPELGETPQDCTDRNKISENYLKTDNSCNNKDFTKASLNGSTNPSNKPMKK